MKKILVTLSLVIVALLLTALVGCSDKKENASLLSKFITEKNTVYINPDEVSFIKLEKRTPASNDPNKPSRHYKILSNSEKDSFVEKFNGLGIYNDGQKRKLTFSEAEDMSMYILIAFRNKSSIFVKKSLFTFTEYSFMEKMSKKGIDKFEGFKFLNKNEQLEALFNEFYSLKTKINQTSYKYDFLFDRNDIDNIRLFLDPTDTKGRLLSEEEFNIFKENIYKLPVMAVNQFALSVATTKVVVTYKNNEKDQFSRFNSMLEREGKILVFEILGFDDFILSTFAK